MRVVNPKEDTFSIAIEFNRKEAEALRAVCEAMSGDPYVSERRYFDQLGEILRHAGVNPSGKLSGSPRFSE